MHPNNIDRNKIINFVSEGVEYLSKNQKKDGSFEASVFSDYKNFIDVDNSSSILPTILILSCLNSIPRVPKEENIKSKIANFILSQKSEHWTFNYWKRGSEESKIRPYPDDLDDTFCALAALFQYDSRLVGGSALAKAAMLLTTVEEKEGGPYRTWLVPENADKAWKDIDLAVNGNIAHFLYLEDVSLENIDSLVEEAIKNKKYYSPYYSSAYSVIYFISRFYKKDLKVGKIADFILSKKESNGGWGDILDTSLAVSALLNLGVDAKEVSGSILYLLKNNSDAYKPRKFYIDRIVKNKKYHVGSSELTVAFYIETLSKYLKKIDEAEIKGKIVDQKIKKAFLKEDVICDKIKNKAIKRFDSLGDELKKIAIETTLKTIQSDKDRQILLLPYFFRMMIGENKKAISDEIIIDLGLANLYGWMAYTIYDDFLDDEGDQKLLPVANVCLRESVKIFNEILPDPKKDFKSFVSRVFDKIDSANAWEVSGCRIKRGEKIKLPDYGDLSKLADRSLGHLLGPIAILYLLGYGEQSKEVKSSLSSFRNYLIARQLNDDAHDWEEDLKKGHINAVGLSLLKNNKIKKMLFGKHKDFFNVFEKNQSFFQQVFWHDIAPSACRDVLRYINRAKKDLGMSRIIKNGAIIEEMLLPIKNSAEKAIKEREEAVNFLKNYARQQKYKEGIGNKKII